MSTKTYTTTTYTTTRIWTLTHQRLRVLAAYRGKSGVSVLHELVSEALKAEEQKRWTQEAKEPGQEARENERLRQCKRDQLAGVRKE
jgi:plasmid stability protein